MQYNAYILFLRFYVYICFDPTKLDLFAHVGDITRYRNDRYYY